jgi:hypothetical protein
MDISLVKKSLTTKRFNVPDQAFRLECNSLKPYTRYFVIFDNLDYTSFCVQDGKRIGEPLLSDGYGNLNFTFHWNRENESKMQQNSQFGKLFDVSIGNKLLTIVNKSGTSHINKTIYFTNNNPDVMFTKYSDSSNIVTT